jgi:hypothetical protein
VKDLVLDVKEDLIGCTLVSSKFMEIFVSLNVALVAVCNISLFVALID